MIMYLAEGGSIFRMIHKKNLRQATNGGNSIFDGVNILQSFYYCDSFTEEIIIPNCKRFFLDSGAFTFMTGKKGARIDWDEYVQRYAAFIIKNKIDHFFELDIDSVVGYDRVKQLRKTLESTVGKPCVPVWHKSRGKEEYVRMCKEYGYVAIGGIVSKEIKPEEYKYFPYLINTAHKHGAKVHGLGFTSLQGIKKYHFDSVDSTSWTTGNRFGQLYMFNGSTVVQRQKAEGVRIANHDSMALHNFKEWVKFQQYAETHL